MALTLDPARRARRLLAAAAAHLEAGSFETAAGLMASADASPLDDMSRAQLDLLRARHAMVGGDPRDGPELWLRAAKRLEPLDLDLARVAHIQAMSAAGIVDGGVSLREMSEAALACPWPPFYTTKEWLLIGHAQFTVDGPAFAAPTLRRALQAPVDDTSSRPGHSIGWDSSSARRCCCGTSRLTASSRFSTSRRRVSSARSRCCRSDSTRLRTCCSSKATSTPPHRRSPRRRRFSTRPEATRLYATGVAIHAGLQGAEGASKVIEDLIARARAGHGFRLASVLWAAAILYNGLGQYEAAFAAATEAIESVVGALRARLHARTHRGRGALRTALPRARRRSSACAESRDRAAPTGRSACSDGRKRCSPTVPPPRMPTATPSIT